jgi:hypothetical protein
MELELELGNAVEWLIALFAISVLIVAATIVYLLIFRL